MDARLTSPILLEIAQSVLQKTKVNLLLRLLCLGDNELADLPLLFQFREGIVDGLSEMPQHCYEFARSWSEVVRPNPTLERPKHGHVGKSHVVGDDHIPSENDISRVFDLMFVISLSFRPVSGLFLPSPHR